VDINIFAPLALASGKDQLFASDRALSMNEQTLEADSAGRNWKVVGIAALFAAGLVVSGVLRLFHLRTENSPALTAYATEIYIGLTILAAILFRRSGVPMRRLGFGLAFKPVRYLVLAAVGVGLIQLVGSLLDPLWERVFDGTRDLARFSDVAGSPDRLIKLLALNWTVAAFGEELAFRIVLMRGIAFALGDSRKAFGVALIVQAVVFGLVHAYQGPAGIFGTAINGLIFGGLTLAARGSIWPAAIAHGSSNSIGIMELYLSG
jgi:membrane protease YdiL (CAAX protease family)